MSPAKKLLWLNISWWIIVSLIHAYVLEQSSFNAREIFVDTFVSFGLLGSVCILMVRTMQYYLPQREKYWYVLFVGLGISGICSLLSKFLLDVIMKNDTLFLQSLHQSNGVRFGIGFLLVSCICMMSLLWYNQEEQKRMNEHTEEAKQMAKDAELYKLRQQLQPHFLFNSLNSISALTGTQPEKARHMIFQLSEFLRGTLKKDEKQWNSLEEEMQYLQLYLEIEKVRFGYRLQTDIFCDENALPLQLPAMLLQPVVENAIKFGLYDTTGEVLIKVEAKKIDNSLQVIVENPFDPETSQPLKGTGFGLASIQRRLFLLFARQDLLQTDKQDNRFITTILIPQKS
ncbi:MAG TPA: histidine kinase [Parafilimonas sp.]|nr:histidine kinase [Parafilimonas sp.]